MHLCEAYNLSIGIPSYKFNNLLYTDDSKTAKGLLGKDFEFFIKSKKKFSNYCKLVNIYKVGEKSENGTYDGALGAIDRKEIDLYLRPEIPFTDNKNIHLSYPVNTEEFFVYQIINKRKIDETEFRTQIFKSISFEYLSFYFLFIFLFFSVFWIICLNLLNFNSTNKMKIYYIFFEKFDKIRHLKIKHLGLIFSGLVWFNFFTKQFITNNIKTSKVIVDTSQFISTEEKLFESPLRAAWLKGESDLFIEIDLYLRAEIPFTDSKSVFLSYPLYSEEFLIYQVIRKKENDSIKFKMQLIESFDFKFLFFYFFVELIFIIIILILNSSVPNFKEKKVIKQSDYKMEIFGTTKFKKLKYFSLIFFGLIWFDFLTKQIMTNNIKTSKVVVDTSSLITSEKKLFESPLKAAWLEGESDLTIVKYAPKDTFLYKLHFLKNDIPIQIFQKVAKLEDLKKINKYFWFIKAFTLKTAINLFKTFQGGDGFYDEKPIYNTFTVFYISKLIDQKKINFIHKIP